MKYCAFCGCEGEKRVLRVFNPHELDAEQAHNWRYEGEHKVISSKKTHCNGKWTTWRVSVWDGTYELAQDPFCSMECGLLFGRRAYENGFRLQQKKGVK